MDCSRSKLTVIPAKEVVKKSTGDRQLRSFRKKRVPSFRWDDGKWEANLRYPFNPSCQRKLASRFSLIKSAATSISSQPRKPGPIAPLESFSKFVLAQKWVPAFAGMTKMAVARRK